MLSWIIWIFEHWGFVSTGLFFLSEALALSPRVRSNSVYQLIRSALKPRTKE